MKCGTLVLFKDARRKGSGKPYRKAVRWYHSDVPRTNIPAVELSELVVCDGTIVATVSTSGGCPCCDGVGVEIQYKCDTCTATHFPLLPRTENELSTFVTNAIAGTPDGKTWV